MIIKNLYRTRIHFSVNYLIIVIGAIFCCVSTGYLYAQPKEKGTLIYENKFDKSQADWNKEMQEHWVLEGKGIPECGNGYLSLRSEIFTVPRDRDGHFNLWLKKDFPPNVAFEWEFRYSEPGEQGLAIIIWAAEGRKDRKSVV